MNKFILWIFESLRNIEIFFRIVCVFFIMMLSIYWIMNIIGASWGWMRFISPILDVILDFVNSIYSLSFDFWGKTMEIKYFNALIIMLIIIAGLKGISILIDIVQDVYENTHLQYKKTKEKIFNNKLEKAVEDEEKQKMQYMLFIQTRPSKKYAHKPSEIDIEEQNNIMNKFLSENFNIQPINTWDGFVYYMNNFEMIDKVLDVLFALIHSPAPLEYFVCIQIGNETKKLRALVLLQEWNKIILSAETLNRYIYNNKNNYKTSNVGIFRKDGNTLEIHEIKEKDNHEII